MGYSWKNWWIVRKYTRSERGAPSQLQLVLKSGNTGPGGGVPDFLILKDKLEINNFV